MRPNSVANFNHLSAVFRAKAGSIQRFSFFTIFIPLTMLFFLLEWDFQVLVFIMLGYSSAFIGFLFANQKWGMGGFKYSTGRFCDLAIENSGDLIFFQSMVNGHVGFANPAVGTLLGYQWEDLAGRPIIFIVHPNDRKKYQQLTSREALQKNKAFKEKLRILKKDGQYLWMELNGCLIDKDFSRKSYLLLNLRDVSATMELEAATRQLAGELRRKQELLERKQKSEHTYSLMSLHDLKAPLLTVKSYVRFFNQKHLQKFNKDGLECMHHIKNGIRRLEEMIDDASNIRKLENRKTAFRKVAVPEVLDTVIDDLQASIKKRNALVLYKELPNIFADPEQIRRLFQNLIDNALKYNDSQRPIIRVSCSKDRGDWLFKVSDNGIGIKPELQDSAFELFRRLHAPGKYPGSGIGLAICKTIAEQHKGSIRVQSGGAGEGCTFLIRIPMENQIYNEKTTARGVNLHNRQMARVRVPVGI